MWIFNGNRKYDNLKVSGAGFGTDTNVVTIITEDGANELPIESKEKVAYDIISEIVGRL